MAQPKFSQKMCGYWVITVLMSFAKFQSGFAEVFSCEIPWNVTMRLSDYPQNYSSNFVRIAFSQEFQFYAHPAKNLVNVRGGTADIYFSDDAGYVRRLAVRAFRAEVTGVATRKVIDNASELQLCRFIAVPDLSVDYANSDFNHVRILAETCMEDVLCRRFARLENWRLVERGRRTSRACLLPSPSFKDLQTIDSFQGIINKAVDVAIVEAVHRLLPTGDVAVPELKVDTPLNANDNLQIHATNGTFRDMRTLSRTSDVVLSERNRVYFISGDFKMGTAAIAFKNITMQGVSGTVMNDTLLVSFSGTHLKMNVSLDYSGPHCALGIQELTTNFWDSVQFDTSLVDQFLFRSVLEPLLKNDEVKREINNLLYNLLNTELAKVDCEIFRPTVKT